MAAGTALGLEMVKKVRKSGRDVPSAKDHVLAVSGAPGLAVPSLMTRPLSIPELKYRGRSTTRPRRAVVVTWTDTPRDTGSDTARPMPPGSESLNTWMVRRAPWG